jgi:hypothetical protein
VTEAENNQARFCREHAVAGNPLFRASVILARGDRRRLTALHALFDLVARIGASSHEEGAARARLDWWRQQCLVDDPADSNHPALRELHRDDGDVLDRAAFARLIEQAELRLEQPAVGDGAGLHALCEGQGRPLLELELGPAAPGILAAPGAAALAARRGLWSLLGGCFALGDPAGAWWIPLDLLARAGLRRADLLDAGRQREAAPVFAGVFDSEPFSSPFETDISKEYQSHVHVFSMDRLIRSKLARMTGKSPGDYAAEMSRVRFGEFLAAWSLARRLSRPK